MAKERIEKFFFKEMTLASEGAYEVSPSSLQRIEKITPEFEISEGTNVDSLSIISINFPISVKEDAPLNLKEKICSVDKSLNSVEHPKILYSDLLRVRNVENAEREDCEDDVVIPVCANVGEQTNAWRRKENIKVSDLELGNFLAEDGMTVKLHDLNEKENARKLINSIVVKVFGGEPPMWLISSELRRKWAPFGKFHLTMLGLGWILCSFPEADQKEAVMPNGPYFVNGKIIGMDKWLQNFSPTSLKGLTAPIWIRLPNLPLHCWDNRNICRIASMNEGPLQAPNGRNNDDSGYGPWLIVNRGKKKGYNKTQKFNHHPSNKVQWKLKKSMNVVGSAGNTDAIGDISALENHDAAHPKNNTDTREIFSIRTAENKFSALEDHVEEGEIIQEKIDVALKESKVAASSIEAFSIPEPVIYDIEKDFSLVKKKKSKQLKDLGPISTNSRSRRMELEPKATMGSLPQHYINVLFSLLEL
ncbi:hypothetical protein KFK09_003793 [Dendrobium nobile]|uniref:DUF4283 domain-containing protein n=1 Tax=Dendrobium nobile TaxID=94219 RepID=A0A8T3C164_DENNO|nr:hypothetical protein KFK09_003793 [Dendrobium nobile]